MTSKTLIRGLPKSFAILFILQSKSQSREHLGSLVAEKELVTNIHRRLKNVCEDNAVYKSTVSRWASRIAGFEKGQAELSKTPRSGRPTTAVTPELLQLADELTRKDRRIATRRLATELSESKGTVNNIIDTLGYAKACARWVPRSLTDDQKTVRKEVCSDLLSR
jgi:transposase